mmetsp:Transcript_5434/g.16450  ORF Transcript_5434/g.16450 Transcript_5434/m.16450 type:complete len:376 (+) Transcript_5434:2021-3148(+)
MLKVGLHATTQQRGTGGVVLRRRARGKWGGGAGLCIFVFGAWPRALHERQVCRCAMSLFQKAMRSGKGGLLRSSRACTPRHAMASCYGAPRAPRIASHDAMLRERLHGSGSRRSAAVPRFHAAERDRIKSASSGEQGGVGGCGRQLPQGASRPDLLNTARRRGIGAAVHVTARIRPGDRPPRRLLGQADGACRIRRRHVASRREGRRWVGGWAFHSNGAVTSARWLRLLFGRSTDLGERNCKQANVRGPLSARSRPKAAARRGGRKHSRGVARDARGVGARGEERRGRWYVKQLTKYQRRVLRDLVEHALVLGLVGVRRLLHDRQRAPGIHCPRLAAGGRLLAAVVDEGDNPKRGRPLRAAQAWRGGGAATAACA